MSENMNEETIGRRVKLAVDANELLDELSRATNLPKGVIIGKALEMFAKASVEDIQAIIMQEAQERAAAIADRFSKK